jgi:hypothetical protein
VYLELRVHVRLPLAAHDGAAKVEEHHPRTGCCWCSSSSSSSFSCWCWCWCCSFCFRHLRRRGEQQELLYYEVVELDVAVHDTVDTQVQ